jgi:octaprenyl-diphosphate synthase
MINGAGEFCLLPASLIADDHPVIFRQFRRHPDCPPCSNPARSWRLSGLTSNSESLSSPVVRVFTTGGHAPKVAGLQPVFALVQSELRAVEERIREQAGEFDPAIASYVSYACETNGKRLRPLVALLTGGATGGIQASHIDLALVVELIHAATLVHDDIIDGADTRRGEPTPNARWGNAISVLLGDCLFAQALRVSTNFPGPEISRKLAAAASDVCSGEIIQTQRRFDLKLAIPEYLRIIDRKTAALFVVAAELGAVLNDASPHQVATFKEFGQKLGIAYQIYDDCLDLAGNEAAAGKTLGTDLQKGKLTLPILHLLRTANEVEHEQLSAILLSGAPGALDQLHELAIDRGAMQLSVAAGQQLLTEARDSLGVAPAGEHRTALEDLTFCLADLLARFTQ